VLKLGKQLAERCFGGIRHGVNRVTGRGEDAGMISFCMMGDGEEMGEKLEARAGSDGHIEVC
jgi:hypothetical protein